ncbi:RluA family pseudouridine synthase [candidate division KSB1 bacterium]|nr:RluA family pseudouridine synthase [candidate division KSB1 bacterium]RQW04578.1 MAG: RluA family pseudouridine synthase [candidate division KSB1 bacterium]
MNDHQSTHDHSLQFVVPSDKKKERLDLFLTHQLPSVTRARLKRLVDEDQVLVNGVPTKAGHSVRPGEVIDIFFPAYESTDLEPEEIPLNIIYEDEYLLVVNKPAGLVVHPAFGNMSGTLVNALLAHCRSLSDVGGPKRPGLVHRLDKDTSGLLVVAKDDVTHVALAEQLSRRKIEREYRAVVWGHLRQKSGRIEAALARNPKDRTKMHVDQRGKCAVTNYEVLEEMTCTSYLKLNLETGRTHQIRVHMMSLGHPVFSDAAYGGRGKQLAALRPAHAKLMQRLLKKFTRQMLHARLLSFRHPTTGEVLAFEAPIPQDMQELIQILRNQV